MPVSSIRIHLELLTFAFLGGILTIYLLTPLMIRMGFALGFVDQPDERRIHKTATPRCGGLGVFAGVSLVLFFMSCRDRFPQVDPSVVNWIRTVLPVSLPLVLLGVLDDRWQIRPARKLLGQIAVSALIWHQGIRLNKMMGFDIYLWMDLGLTVLLFTAAMNAYNLIDGMDGVAAGLAAITSLGLCGLNLLLGNESMAAVCLVLTGACLGFLRYNFHPARIFLGDTGSMYLGFMLMAAALDSPSRSAATVMLVVPLLTMGVPLIDTGLAIWRRSIRKAISPDQISRISGADKDHLHHRLARRGLNQRRVAVILYSLQGIIFGVGLLWVFLQNHRMAIFTIAFFIGSYVVLRYLASLEMSDSGRWIVDGIRRPGRSQLFSSLMPLLDILILSVALMTLSYLFGTQSLHLRLGRLVRHNSAPIIGIPMIFIWALRYYRLQWTRARAIDFFSLGLVCAAGLWVGLALSTIPHRHSTRETLLIGLVLMTLTVPPMVILRAFPRLVQDLLHYHDRRRKEEIGRARESRVLIYGAGYGFTLITRAESFDDSPRRRHYFLAGLLDDNPHLRGRVVHGHRVLGGLSDLPALARELRLDEILVSTQLQPENQTKLLALAESLNLRVTLSVFTQQVLRDRCLTGATDSTPGNI